MTTAGIMPINLKRAYDPPDDGDGYRVLVDRLWPRGLRKETAALDAWMKEVAPSNELRRWFGHDPARWDEFRRRYARELDDRPDAVAFLRGKSAGGVLTLLYGARDREHNNAVALEEYLGRR